MNQIADHIRTIAELQSKKRTLLQQKFTAEGLKIEMETECLRLSRLWFTQMMMLGLQRKKGTFSELDHGLEFFMHSD